MSKHSGRLELTWTDKEKALLSSADGKYDYTFADRSDPRVLEVRLLHEVDRFDAGNPPDRAADLPSPTTDNLLVTGDAMHVLDALRKTPEWAARYVGKVKLVYIDPPFNTGQSFDQYDDNLDHSIWLTMLRDRVRQLVPLLARNGSIWLHLDDAEVHRCRSVLDEELGPENFVGAIVWAKADTSRNDAKQFSTDQDYLLVYSKMPGWRPNRLGRSAAQDAIYSAPDGDSQPWLAKPGHAPGAQTHVGMVYGVQSPFTGEILYPPTGGCWRLGEDRMFKALNEWAPYKRVLLDDLERRSAICDLPVEDMRDVEAMVLDTDLEEARNGATRVQTGVLPEVFFLNDGALIQVKGYKPVGLVPRTVWGFREVGSNRNSKAEIKTLFPGRNPFATPKPERLLQRVIHLATQPGDLVLDCFAGSGTTAAVAHKMGRRWIASELLPDTVAQFTKPRLLKVINNHDPGGITTVTTRVAGEGVVLPQDVGPKSAQEFQTMLGRVLENPLDDEHETPPKPLTIAVDKILAPVIKSAQRAGNETLTNEEVKALLRLLRKLGSDEDLSTVDITKQVKSDLTKRIRTRNESTTLWHGGGGFSQYVVGPSMYEVDAETGDVYLSEIAVNGDWSKSVAAQLRFTLTPNHRVFCGVRGRQRLAVIDGVADEVVVRTVIENLADKERAIVVAKIVLPEAEELLHELSPGSRLKKAPRDLFPKRTVK